MEKANQKIISTKSCTNYSFLIQNRKLLGILVENSEESVFYSFNPEEDVPKVNNEIFEAALKALLKSNAASFDILSECFYGLKEQDEYLAIAVKVFKDYWNELYNLVIADTAFKRDRSFRTLEKKYDFWNENK